MYLEHELKVITFRINNSSINSRHWNPLKKFWSGTTILLTSNEQIEDMMKTIKPLEGKCGFLSILLGILGAGSLGNLLTGKRGTRAGEGTFREIHGL